MSGEPTHSRHEETPVPSTAAEDGRRKHGAYVGEYRPHEGEIQAALDTRVAQWLSVECLESNGADKVVSYRNPRPIANHLGIKGWFNYAE